MVNAIVALALLMSYLAVHISPETFSLPAFFGLAYPYLLLLNILMVLAWLMLLRWEAVISLVVILAGITHFSNYIKLSKPSGSKSDTIKVMSYNLHMFNYQQARGDNQQKKILDFLHAQKPDILCVQEYLITGPSENKDEAIRDALGGKYYSHIKGRQLSKSRFYGIATFSRYPIVNRGDIIHPGSFSTLTIFTDVLIGRDTFRIYNNHLQSFLLKKMETNFLNEMTSSEKETMSEVKHISGDLKRGFARRAMQAEAVKNSILKSPYPVIVAGDFNDTPVSYTYRKIRKGLNDSFVSSGYGAGFTYRGNYPPNRIDYILYDDALTSSYFEIMKSRYSDHYPIIAYFRKKR